MTERAARGPMGAQKYRNAQPAPNVWITGASRVDKPWGHESIFALVPGKYCGKTLHVRAGHALSLQYHELKEETMMVQSGRVRLDVGLHESALDSLEMGPGDVIHLRPTVRHRVTAIVDSLLLESSTTELEDVIRLDDRYGRALQ